MILRSTVPSPAAATTSAVNSCTDMRVRRSEWGDRASVLAYHQVSSTDTGYRYDLSCAKFESHLRLLEEREAQHSDCARDILGLSFDDGYMSNYETAVPILEKHSRKATFFIIVGRVGNRSDFMNWAQLRELVSLGHYVAVHSWSHLFLTQCSDHELRRELLTSREVLEYRLGIGVDSLSAPHGRWDGRVAAACAAYGYRRLYTSDPWVGAKRQYGIELVGRLMVDRTMDSLTVQRWMDMGKLEARVRRATHQLKHSGRHLLGDKLYHKLWTRASGWKGGDDIG